MRTAILTVLAAALLAVGCAGREVEVRFWDLDAPVLPLLTEQSEEPGPRLLKQYVVLLPDDDGTVGAIEVSDGETTVVLDEAYQAVSFDNLEEPYMVDRPETDVRFAPEVAHLPRPPMSFTVYFEYASPQLTAESREALPRILAEITSRSAPDLRLHGHADRAGTNKNNKRMSKRRVEAIRDRILEAGVAGDFIDVRWHGEDMPAVATEDGVSEARNRRVEIRIR
jgi:OOP family OmpA-OmpF porin